jgi:glycosyltransferase involved in cell wall biosynthesis
MSVMAHYDLAMKVSVLIPAYNSERHLSECLASVLAQDFDDMEILISDDCSTDGTRKIIAACAARDARVRWWQTPKNLGLIANHNHCLQQARGEYVKFVHADDKLLSTSAIRKMVAALDDHPTAVLVGCRQHLTGAKTRPYIFSQISGVYDGRQMVVASLEQNTNLIGQPTLTLFRRGAARRGFDPRFTGHLDFEMWCHLLEQGDFAYLAADLATWRVHAAQQTARLERTGSARNEQLLFVEAYYAKPWLKKLATRRMLFAQIYYLKKKYGGQAHPLAAALLADLSWRHFVWQWLKHKATRPVQKIDRKAGSSSQLLMPRSVFSLQ